MRQTPCDEARRRFRIRTDFCGTKSIALLAGCDRIIHAGDVGKEAVLARLQEIAPTLAVRGNVDRGAWADRLPQAETMIWNEVAIHVLHDLNDLSDQPSARRNADRHQRPFPSARAGRTRGVTYLNPGSVGPRRFRLPVTMAWLHSKGVAGMRVEPVTLLD